VSATRSHSKSATEILRRPDDAQLDEDQVRSRLSDQEKGLVGGTSEVTLCPFWCRRPDLVEEFLVIEYREKTVLCGIFHLAPELY
jgi:hypothetical protein